MKALSIRQPWAWLILHACKDIENRNWPTAVRGRVLIHAGKVMTRIDYEDACYSFRAPIGCSGKAMPSFETIERGGIIGSVEIVDCVTESESPWFFGRYGYVLRDPRPLPFAPWRGQLGFFDVPMDEFDSVIVRDLPA